MELQQSIVEMSSEHLLIDVVLAPNLSLHQSPAAL